MYIYICENINISLLGYISTFLEKYCLCLTSYCLKLTISHKDLLKYDYSEEFQEGHIWICTVSHGSSKQLHSSYQIFLWKYFSSSYTFRLKATSFFLSNVSSTQIQANIIYHLYQIIFMQITAPVNNSSWIWLIIAMPLKPINVPATAL